jgi:hypothetical protein
MDCAMVAAAPVLPVGYVASASRIADRRMILAGYRLADLLKANDDASWLWVQAWVRRHPSGSRREGAHNRTSLGREPYAIAVGSADAP